MLDGFFELADLHNVALVGGDTTRGPLALAVTAIGQVRPREALHRDAARPGDDVWVTGTLGDAPAALALEQGGMQPDPYLHGRLLRPSPRAALGSALRGIAHA